MKKYTRHNESENPRPALTRGATLALMTAALVLGADVSAATGATVEYDLTVARETLQITDKPVHGMTINGTIPGPTLRFTEGDTARIHVHNNMPDATSIHWHGLLVPPEMDGVPYVSFPPIQPGATFTYEFPIRQSGTYWYHSHSGLQEQSGMYGSIVIKPKEESRQVDGDHVILLSDWTDEDPHTVNRTLKRGSEWYAIQKGAGQSILGAARLGMLGDYFKRELQRMPPMDIADVAYDRFLANGKPESDLSTRAGETVRLRIINGSATTYFHVEFAGSPMTIIAADGMDVEPVEKKRFLIAVAETYDVLVTVPESDACEFRATAHDGSGYASVWLGSGRRRPAPDVPRPNVYHAMGPLSLKRIFALTPAGSMGMPDRDVEAGMFDQPGMMGMKDMDMDMDKTEMASMPGMSHGKNMAAGKEIHHPAGETEARSRPPQSGKRFGRKFGLLAADVSASDNLAEDGIDASRPWAPYADLRAVRPTGFATNLPVREIRLTLDGDMERYVWFLNNKALSESDSIRVRKGEVTRFIMINRTMMHHPMHLHGQFFRVINGQGDSAPLKHTVDAAPMSTTVIEFNGSEFGDWFFHCHLLYHMKGGMARVVHYEGYTLNHQLSDIRSRLYEDSWYAWGQADVLNNMTEGFVTLVNTRTILAAGWEVGWEDVEETESEAIFTCDRYVNRFFSGFVGVDVLAEGNEVDETRGVFGIRYHLPLNFESRVWVDTDGGARVNLEKVFELTPRAAVHGEVQYDTHDLWEGTAGLSYTINRMFSIKGQWHSEFGWGGGVQVRF